MEESRPATPNEVKRLLRKEAGFGCCVCGNPIVDYQHIIPWSVENHFRVEDMMCLCPNHHDQATKGAMPENVQRRYKYKPFNIEQGHVGGMLTINHSVPIVRIGSCNFVGTGDFISVDEYRLLGLDIEEASLLISLKLYDDADNLILDINKNEWVSGDRLPWDIEASYQYLKIRHKARDICLEINTKQVPIMMRAKLLYQNQQFEFSPDKILFDGVVKQITMINISYIGLKLNASSVKNALEITPSLPHRDGILLSGTDINDCIENWNKIAGHQAV